jgi:hypothetical protein
LVQVLVFGCAYWRIADESCSATTLRRRRDEWIEAGLMDTLEEMARESYDRVIGLDMADVAVDCCITKAPCGGEKAGRSPVDRGKQGIKRSVVVDAGGIPEPVSVHLDRGYDSNLTRRLLEDCDMVGVISEKGKPSPLSATKRWVVERTNSWTNAHKKLVWCTEREGRVVDFWITFSNVIIIVGRLVREAWNRYRWETRPTRRP